MAWEDSSFSSPKPFRFHKQEDYNSMNKSVDRLCSLLFACIGIGFILESRKITQSSFGGSGSVGSDIFPFGLGLILVLLSIGLFIETFKYKEQVSEKQYFNYKKFIIILVAGVLYGLFLEDIGYVIGTFLFLLIGFQTMNRGKWITSILISGVFSVGVYYLFVGVLQGNLPGFPAW